MLNEALPLCASIATMDQSSSPQNRKSRRSHVLMSASLELSGMSLPVKLRNLSVDGALIEADRLPVEGSSLLFRKGDLSVPGRVAWAKTRHAGISFVQKLDPDQVLRHIPVPRPRVKPDFRRPSLKPLSLTEEERRYGELWLWGGSHSRLGE